MRGSRTTSPIQTGPWLSQVGSRSPGFNTERRSSPCAFQPTSCHSVSRCASTLQKLPAVQVCASHIARITALKPAATSSASASVCAIVCSSCAKPLGANLRADVARDAAIAFELVALIEDGLAAEVSDSEARRRACRGNAARRETARAARASRRTAPSRRFPRARRRTPSSSCRRGRRASASGSPLGRYTVKRCCSSCSQ